MKQTIRLTESELRNMIEASINEAIQDEGKTNQFLQGVKSFFGKGNQGKQNIQNDYYRSTGGGLNLKKRWDAAKTNYKTQGVIDNVDAIKNPLSQMIQDGTITTQTTIGQLFQLLGRQKGTATNQGSQAMNRIYK